MVSVFRRYFTRYMNALRVAAWGMPDASRIGPVVVYSNHPAWWDAAVYILAADRFFPSHESYAPIDAAMLKQYGIFGRIGAFGVDLETSRGGAEFMAASAEILASPKRALWVTAQGRFSDVRERPLWLKPGIARLVEIAPDCTIIPLAIEYGFWLERGAEAFIAFGTPLRGEDLIGFPRAQRLEYLERELTSTLDHLSADVQARDPARFRPVLEGRSGIGGLYDGWRRLTSALRGRSFDPSHEGRHS
ncbi:lysophospholipid acyltransferase family protein [Microvirga sp. 2YAF29]|uniref:lysophospholipid acyltransferase family protein n=1 Tax=Microvirga sp. 2YAF29 TaxID=3233031 RepID=UPI003F984653